MQSFKWLKRSAAYPLLSPNFRPYLFSSSGRDTSLTAIQPSSVIVQCTPSASYIGRAAMTIREVTGYQAMVMLADATAAWSL
jgi:hypothetical protein